MNFFGRSKKGRNPHVSNELGDVRQTIDSVDELISQQVMSTDAQSSSFYFEKSFWKKLDEVLRKDYCERFKQYLFYRHPSTGQRFIYIRDKENSNLLATYDVFKGLSESI